jgi:hypothetical protein
MPLKIITTLVIIILFNVGAMANINMRRCLILPIEDNLGGALSFKVFKELEQSLKNSDWCVYRSNSTIMDILSNHRKNLNKLISDPKVMKVIAEKTESGSLIKIDLIKEINGITIKLKIFGANGEDVYFAEKTQSKNDDYNVVSQIVKNWLDVYSKQIPYEGKVVGVLGSQFTVDAGKNRSIFQNNEIVVIRAINKKRHPLLKEIVDWETEKVAEGKVVFSTGGQSQGIIKRYTGKKKIKIGDWVILRKKTLSEGKDSVERAPFDLEDNEYKFGKMGTVSLNLLLGKSSATTENSGTIAKMSGRALGLELDARLWITRKYWAALGLSRAQSTMKGREGVGSTIENSVSTSNFNARFGYKYLPMGFFNGPQVDFYGGFSSQKYSMDTLTTYGLTEISFSGILMGVAGTLPLQNVFRLEMDLSFIFNPGYQELASTYGEDDSANSYKIRFGGRYLYAPNITLDIFYGITSSKASFLSPVRSIQAKISAANLGATYTF